MAADDQQTSESAAPATKLGGAYSHYVLFVLVIVMYLISSDRNILSILSQDIQADLGVSDAEMGFLYGTVFAVFYAVFGIPLARFADVWVRRSLISLGLVFWSAMTALSGFARSFLYSIFLLGSVLARPVHLRRPIRCSRTITPRLRATVIAIYSSGVYIGGGIGLFLGGFIMKAGIAPFQIRPRTLNLRVGMLRFWR